MSTALDQDGEDFCRFFVEHLKPEEQAEIYPQVALYYTECQAQGPKYQNLMKDAVALIHDIEPLGTEIERYTTNFRRMRDELYVEDSNNDVRLNSIRKMQKKMGELCRMRNGLVRFVMMLFKRFLGFGIRNDHEHPFLFEHLSWRFNRAEACIDKTEFEEMGNWITARVENAIGGVKKSSKPGVRIKKVQSRYPVDMLQLAFAHANERAAKNPLPKHRSQLLEEPRKFEVVDGSGTSLRPWYVGVDNLKGGIGKLRLLVRTNEHGAIADRIVEKNTAIAGALWQSPETWYGLKPRLGTDVQELMPLEWYTQFMASTQPDSRSIMGLRSVPRISLAKQLYQFYVEYAPHGDLDMVLRVYRKAGFIPFSFLVYVFKSLVEAGLILEKGGIDTPRKDWKQIVHRDLKPGNVFLDQPLSDYFPHYPRARLADFGHARLTWEDDPSNPTLYNRGGGTDGYYPPEQLQFIDEKTGEPVDNFKVLSPANVWGVGAVMKALMCRYDEKEKYPKVYLETDLQHRLTWHIDDKEILEFYGPWLVSRVEACLRIHPDERPTFEQLNAELEQFISESDFLRHERDVGNVDNTLLDLKQPPYKLGMAFDPDGVVAVYDGFLQPPA